MLHIGGIQDIGSIIELRNDFCARIIIQSFRVLRKLFLCLFFYTLRVELSLQTRKFVLYFEVGTLLSYLVFLFFHSSLCAPVSRFSLAEAGAHS